VVNLPAGVCHAGAPVATADLTSADGGPQAEVPPEPRPTPGQAKPAGRALVRVSALLGWLGVLTFLLAVVLAVLPVRDKRPEVYRAATEAKRAESGQKSVYVFRDGSTTLQDCGGPLAFVVQGRTQPTYGGGKTALERAREKEANAHPCTGRVAARLVPAGLLSLATLVLSIVSFFLAYLGRSRARSAGWRRHADPVAAAPVPPNLGGTPSPV